MLADNEKSRRMQAAATSQSDHAGSGLIPIVEPEPAAAGDIHADQVFQPMPALSPEQHASLVADITANGVGVPITVDQFGRILDGHNRSRIASELGLECPRVVQHVVDDDDAADRAIALNCARRHLTQAQVRQVVAGEIERRPEQSDREIARRVGCSPTTVGTVRRQVSNLDSPDSVDLEMERRRAVELTNELKLAADEVIDAIQTVVMFGLSNGVTPTEMLGALTIRSRRFSASDADLDASSRASTAEVPQSGVVLMQRLLIDPAIDFLLDESRTEPFTVKAGGPGFKGLTPDERNGVLAALSGDNR